MCVSCHGHVTTCTDAIDNLDRFNSTCPFQLYCLPYNKQARRRLQAIACCGRPPAARPIIGSFNRARRSKSVETAKARAYSHFFVLYASIGFWK